MAIPAERPQLSEEVAATLRGRIMSGDLRPGARIRLEEVAAQLGVSITPVREALLTLRGEDMVELEPRKGYVVSPLSKQDVIDLFQLQGNIAGELAARVAERITGPQLTEITLADRALARAARARRTGDIERLEFEFHRSINLVAQARKLSWFLHVATRYTPARFYAADPAWRDGMRDDHEALLAAFGAHDAATARAVMTRHFTDGAELLVKHLDELGIWA
ncbi:putative GntR-family transcriptional regulator [Actinoplanes missouriensis 431]|uniref:Putative GntR-family transcriptional regulator n=1 Tax=Actinoplanes missouriensis (strain ATCC 14538 / DSM 43046 / CBS 188.64 / JCM 3121 / NBRC 102363 / NCIMB 12654 / NRRL B-3342 / UNCC 431) TaxID=512565 RepID=I0H3D3_ACTM4|nr:GntR family transcriptional regulator [Actinoplanes missouriensis]BAL87520.1 putative GntR-family transcriptional regulator [Actinoplanes missouriensis 431]